MSLLETRKELTATWSECVRRRAAIVEANPSSYWVLRVATVRVTSLTGRVFHDSPVSRAVGRLWMSPIH